MKKLIANKKELYNRIFILSTAFLIFSAILFSIYLIAPLLGGKLSIPALKGYASWILVALAARIFSQRGRKGHYIRLFEYLILCLAAIVNFVVWFSYPINIILSTLCVIGIGISWKSQQRIKDKNKELS